MARNDSAPGSAHRHLSSSVRFLHEEEVVFDAMLSGWSAQMIGGRALRPRSVSAVLAHTRAFQRFTNEWPWKWSSSMFDEWMAEFASRGRALSTRRAYQNAVRSFCSYLCSPHYGWVEECEKRFASHPIQVCHEGNTLRHTDGAGSDPGRRGLTRQELQLFLDRADQEVELRLEQRRKGAALAYRDSTVFKVLYAWGLRANELCHLDTTDLFRLPNRPEFGSIGLVQVRMGKGSHGSGPKRRVVASLHQWAVDALQDYLDEVRPMLIKNGRPTNAVFLTERGTRLKPRDISDRFAYFRGELQFDQKLTPHSLRHSYSTHLALDGVDPRIISDQLGHAFQSTTLIYTHITNDFKNRMMQDAIRKVLQPPGPVKS